MRDRDDEMYKHKMRNNGAKYARLVVVGTLTPDPAAEKEKKSLPTHTSISRILGGSYVPTVQKRSQLLHLPSYRIGE